MDAGTVAIIDKASLTVFAVWLVFYLLKERARDMKMLITLVTAIAVKNGIPINKGDDA